MDNTTRAEDRYIREADDVGDTVDGLLEIIERLDAELTRALDEIEMLKDDHNG